MSENLIRLKQIKKSELTDYIFDVLEESGVTIGGGLTATSPGTYDVGSPDTPFASGFFSKGVYVGERIKLGDDVLTIEGGQLKINGSSFQIEGLRGETGPTGAVGPSGATGSIGEVGPSGLIGPSGQTGSIGTTGPSGLRGLTGGSGVDGKNVIGATFYLQDMSGIYAGENTPQIKILDVAPVLSNPTLNLLKGYTYNFWYSDLGVMQVQTPAGATVPTNYANVNEYFRLKFYSSQSVYGRYLDNLPANSGSVIENLNGYFSKYAYGASNQYYIVDNEDSFSASIRFAPNTPSLKYGFQLINNAEEGEPEQHYIIGAINLLDHSPTGPQGVQGVVGPEGLEGERGLIGLTGSTGLTGPTGAKGETGNIGLQGLVGATGPSLAGEQGYPGPEGEKGEQGIIGPLGPVGNDGPKGDRGDSYKTTFAISATVSKNLTSPVKNIVVNNTTAFTYEDIVEITSQHIKNLSYSTGQKLIFSLVGSGTSGANPLVYFGGRVITYDEASGKLTVVIISPSSYAGISPNIDALYSLSAYIDVNLELIEGAQGFTGSKGATGDRGFTGPVGPAGAISNRMMGAWDNEITYIQDDVVLLDGSSYISVASSNLNHTPGVAEDAYWRLIASKGNPGVAGPLGPSGPVGGTGEQGSGGPQGPRGFTGSQGERGFGGSINNNFRGQWDSATSYGEGDVVSYLGNTHISLEVHSDSLPSAAIKWKILAEKGNTGSTGTVGATGGVGPAGIQGVAGVTGERGPYGDFKFHIFNALSGPSFLIAGESQVNLIDFEDNNCFELAVTGSYTNISIKEGSFRTGVVGMMKIINSGWNDSSSYDPQSPIIWPNYIYWPNDEVPDFPEPEETNKSYLYTIVRFPDKGGEAVYLGTYAPNYDT